jgi:hypothetical protein
MRKMLGPYVLCTIGMWPPLTLFCFAIVEEVIPNLSAEWKWSLAGLLALIVSLCAVHGIFLRLRGEAMARAKHLATSYSMQDRNK